MPDDLRGLCEIPQVGLGLPSLLALAGAQLILSGPIQCSFSLYSYAFDQAYSSWENIHITHVQSLFAYSLVPKHSRRPCHVTGIHFLSLQFD